MNEVLRTAKLFHGLTDQEAERLARIARPQSLSAGEYLFMLGDHADRLYVVVQGAIDLCFPIPIGGETKDITVETAPAGKTLGWSALVKPYRFTLSGRVAEPTEVYAFTRSDLVELFDAEPRIGHTFITRISELVGIRLLKVQALWVRELQRSLAAETAHTE